MIKFFTSQGLSPVRGSEHAAGFDLYNNGDDTVIGTGEIITLDTYTAAAIPDGFVGLAFVRSSLGAKGLALSNAVGVIDSDYRGTIKAKVYNTSGTPITIAAGERFMQLVVVPYIGEAVDVSSIEELGDTDRGTGGFGSTGTK